MKTAEGTVPICHFENGDTCSWKGQLEKTRSWKVRHEIGKNEVGKFALKLECSALSNFAQALSNLNRNFPTCRFSNCPFQLHVSHKMLKSLFSLESKL